MDILNEYHILYVFIVLLGGGSIVNTANYLDANDLEKKLTTNFEKLTLILSMAYILTFMVSIITTWEFWKTFEIWQFWQPRISSLIGKDVKINSIYGYSIIFLASTFLTSIGLFIIGKFKPEKFKFLITMDDNIQWEIIKVTGKKFLLLKEEDHQNYKIIKNYKNLSIRKENKTKEEKTKEQKTKEQKTKEEK